MKESIFIRNVGPLKDIEIDDIRPFTVFIGESACGKSTLMKVIVLFRYIYKMLNIRWYLKNSGVNKSPFRLSFEKLLNDDIALYIRSNKQAYIKYVVNVNGHDYPIEYVDGKLKTDGFQKILNEDLYFLKESWVSESRNVIPEWNANAVSGRKADLNFYFNETLADFGKATDKVSNFNMDYVGMKMKVVRQNSKKKFYVAPEDESYDPIELQYASSGIQTSAPLMAIVDYFAKFFSFKDAGKRSILNYLFEQDRLSSFRPDVEINNMHKKVHIHIEEPEISLFPTAQCKMIDSLTRSAFVDKTDDREVDLMMATHSPYIVNYLNILLHQDKEGRAFVPEDKMAVYRIYDGRLHNLMVRCENGTAVVNTEDMTEQMNNILLEYVELVKA